MNLPKRTGPNSRRHIQALQCRDSGCVQANSEYAHVQRGTVAGNKRFGHNQR